MNPTISRVQSALYEIFTIAIMSNLDHFMIEIDKLRRHIEGNRRKPHKLALLLAVIDLFEQGIIHQNRIEFCQVLIESFKTAFQAIKSPQDWCLPSLPFIHLRSSDFWYLVPKAGREEIYTNMKTPGGGKKRILDNVEYAYLSDYAFEVISDSHDREVLKQYILWVAGTAW